MKLIHNSFDESKHPRDKQGRWTVSDRVVSWAGRNDYSRDAAVQAFDHARSVYNETLLNGADHPAADTKAREAFHQRMRVLDSNYKTDSWSASIPDSIHEALAISPAVVGISAGTLLGGLPGAGLGMALGSIAGLAIGGSSWLNTHGAKQRLQSNPAMKKAVS